MQIVINQILEEGIAAHEAGQLDEAERLYRFILQSQPAHPEANHNLGVLAISINEVKVALPLFKTALGANSKNEQFWLSYIDALIKDQQFGNALQLLEQARKHGVDADSLNALERQFSPQTQNPGTAQVSPPEELLNSLLSRYHNGQLNDAERLSVEITQDFPKHQLAWKVLGAVLGATGRKSEAIDANKTAVALSPQDPEAHGNLGVMLEELGRLDEAEASYRQAIALKPDYAEAYSNLGLTCQGLGKLDEAEASFRKSSELQPNSAEVQYNLGLVLTEMERFDEAKISYSRAINLNPYFAEAQNNLGLTFQELGDLNEAEASFRQAIMLKPDYADAHYNLGITLKGLGRLDEAEASYKKAIALKPDYAEAHYNLGNILNKLGRLEEAEVSYTKAIESKRDFASALYNRSQLLFNKAQYEAALRDTDACILNKAKVRSLISLYALGRISEFYKRLELLSKSDAGDLNLAAFATFISSVEKRPTAFNFCPNPIDFIHVANLSSHVIDSVTYVESVIIELNKIQTVWEPDGKSTVNGFQSLQSINLFQKPAGKIAKLKSIIVHELEVYYSKFKSEQCKYIKNFPTTRNLFGWTVTLKQQGHQNAHIHPGGWLSGVIYLRVVPSLGKDEGAIEFSLNSVDYHDARSRSLIFHPKAGDLILFPSSLHHKTIPFTTEKDRIIVSFDLIPEAVRN